MHSQRKCSNLPISKSGDEHIWWVGSWRYFVDSEHKITIQENGDVDGGSYSQSTCEEVIITKNHSATSDFVWGHMILKKANGGLVVCDVNICIHCNY